MSLYNPNKDSNALRESPRFAFSFVLAIIQLICVASALWVLQESFSGTGYDKLVAIWVVIPYFLGSLVAPINLFTSLYYFYKYRDDPPGRKWIVGLSLVASILMLLILSRNH